MRLIFSALGFLRSCPALSSVVGAIVHTEREKMLRGELYDPTDPELVSARERARRLLGSYNSTLSGEGEEKRALLSELFGAIGDGAFVQPPFYCDYGKHIFLGRKVYLNFNCVILDVCEVAIGDHTLLGPNVQIYTATHPLDFEKRRSVELGKRIVIGGDAWIGGGAIICPGVTIGDRTIIGAGSVVTKDVPAGVVAAGNPCRVIRELPV